VAKRRKRSPKAKARTGRPRRVAARLPGGRETETVHQVDDEGWTVTLVRTVDTLARMRKVGTITRAMHHAARDFQRDFTIAAYDAVPIASLVHVRRRRGEKIVWDDEPTLRQIAQPGTGCTTRCRRSVAWRARAAAASGTWSGYR